MDEFLVDIIGYALTALSIVGSIVGSAFALLRQQTQKVENEFLQSLLTRAVDVADAVAVGAFGHFDTLTAAARAAESDGGPEITQEEWKSILDDLWAEFLAGFGTDWFERAGQVVGLVPFERQVRSQIEATLVTQLDEKRAANAPVEE